MGKIRMRSTALSDNPELKAPVFNFSKYVADGEHTYKNNEEQIDFVTANDSLYVCLSHDGVTPTYEDIDDNADFLKLVSQGPQGIRGPRGYDGNSAETPRLNAEFDNDQLRVYINGELETVSPRLTGKSWRPKLEDNMIVWELSNKMYAPEPIDLEELRPIQERPLLLRVDSDNTKRTDEKSGPARFIQWKYEGEGPWTNLISISELMNLTLAGITIFPVENTETGKTEYHLGHKEVLEATYDSDKDGHRIISNVELGHVLFDAGPIPIGECSGEDDNDFQTQIDGILVEIANIKTSMVKSVNNNLPNPITGDVHLDYLTEHQHLKTINNQSLIGDGNITISAGGVSLFDVKIEGGHLWKLWKTTDGQDWIDLGAINTGSGGSGMSESDVKQLIGRILEGLEDPIPGYNRASDHNYFIRLDDLADYATIDQVRAMIRDIETGQSDYYRVFTLYQRTGSATTPPNLPVKGVWRWNTDPSVDFITLQPNAESDWNNHPTNAEENAPYLWMTSATYSYLTKIEVGNWETPVCLTGENGREGEDGKGIEFIYHLGATAPNIDYTKSKNYNDNTTASRTKAWWATEASEDSCPGDGNNGYWTDDPVGVDDESEDTKIEWASIRKSHYDSASKTTVWEDFCTPFIWSMWGEDGVDGAGVEYIFAIAAENETIIDPDTGKRELNASFFRGGQNPLQILPLNDEEIAAYEDAGGNYQIDDWCPDGTMKSGVQMYDLNWTDNPSDVGPDQPYEFVAIRKKKLDPVSGQMKWGPFSEPAMWGFWGTTTVYQPAESHFKPYTCFAFTRSTTDITGYTVVNPWTYANQTYAAWIAIDSTREDGYYNNPLTYVVTLNENNQVVSSSTLTWSDTIPAPPGQLYMITNHIGDEASNSDQGWTNPRAWGDASGFQVEYAKADEDTTDNVYNRLQGYTLPKLDNYDLDNYPNLNDPDNDGIDEEAWRTAVRNSGKGVWGDENDIPDPDYMATCYKKQEGVWSNWQISRIKGERGDDSDVPGPAGKDGTDIEFVYFRTDAEDHRPGMSPTAGTYNGQTKISEDLYKDDFLPMATANGFTLADNELKIGNDFFWHDHPAGVTENLSCEWVAMRHSFYDLQGDKLWGNFNIALWSKYGANGRDGDGIEYVFFPVTKEQHEIIKEYQFRLNNKLYVGKLPVSNNAIMNGQSFAQNGNPAESEFLPYSQEITGVSPIRAQDDNPGGTDEKPYVYCSQRKYKFNGTSSSWGDFGPASLWVVLDTPETIICRSEIDNDTIPVIVNSQGVVQTINVTRSNTTRDSYLYNNHEAKRIDTISINGTTIATLTSSAYTPTNTVASVTETQNNTDVTVGVTTTKGNVDSSDLGIGFELKMHIYGTNPKLTSDFIIPVTFSSEGKYVATSNVKLHPITEESFDLNAYGNIIKTNTYGSKDYSPSNIKWDVSCKNVSDENNDHLEYRYLQQYWFGFDGGSFIKFSPNSFLTAQDKEELEAQQVTLEESPSHTAYGKVIYFNKSGNKISSENVKRLSILTWPQNAYFAYSIYQRDFNDNKTPWARWVSFMLVNLAAFANDASNYPVEYITVGGGGNDIMVDTEDIPIIYNGDPVILQNTGAKLVSMNVGSEEVICTDEQNQTASLSVVRANSVAESVDENLLNWYSDSTQIEDNYTLGQNDPAVISSSSVLGVTKEGDGFINVTKTGADDNLLKVNLNVDALVEELIHRFGGRPVVQGTSIESVSSGNVSVNGGYVHQGEQITITGEPGSTVAGLYTDTSYGTEITTLDANGQATGYVGNNNVTITDSTGPSSIPTLNVGNVTPGVAPAPSVVAALYVSVPSNSNGEAQLTFNSISQDAAATVTYTLTFSRAVQVTSVEGSTSHSAITGDYQNTVTVINPDPREIWIDFNNLPEGTLMWVYATASVVYDNEEPTVYTSAKKYFKTTKRALITPFS